MGALLYNATLLQHDYAIGVADGGKAVGDNQKGGTVLLIGRIGQEAVQCLLYLTFALGVEGTGSFVENEYVPLYLIEIQTVIKPEF